MTAPLAHVGGGTLEPLQLLVPAVAGIGYYVRASTLARHGRSLDVARQLSFAVGLALIVLALVSPVSHLGEELLLAHMAQHLAMADVGALLVVLGLTGPLLQPLLRLRPVDRLRPLTHPAVALPLWVANLYLWHVPALYQGALASEWLHVIEHGAFVFFGINMWLALLGPLPKPAWFGNGARLGYVVAVRFAGALLGNVFMWAGVIFYPDYAAGEAYWGISPQADQVAAGVIMMVEGSILTILLFGWLFLKAARETDERQELLELAARSGFELDERRAARAVAAGHADGLRRRIADAAAPREAATGGGAPGRPGRAPAPSA